MSTIAAESIAIALVTLPGNRCAQLRLDRDGRIYDLVKVFSARHHDRAQQYLQQLIERDPAARDDADVYMLVRERGYYSLWQQAQISRTTDNSLTLQQASLYLLQELWVQWEELMGTQQLQIFARQLFAVTPRLKSATDLDRLLNLDPFTNCALDGWTQADWIALDSQLDRLTHQKMGERFGAKLIAEIIDSLPAHLSPALVNIVNISA